MYCKTVLLFLSALLSTPFLIEADEDASGSELLKIPLDRRRTLPASFNYFNANQVQLQLHNNHNWSYSAVMAIGTPPQKLRIEFDTGSADLWVAGPPVCKTNPLYCDTHRTFNNSASTTYKELGRDLRLPYGSEVIDIDIAIDDFVVHGLKIKNQYFGLAYKIENFVNQKYQDNKDGIFGLAFEELSVIHKETGHPSPLMNLIKQGQLPQPVFAFYLTHPMSKHSEELVMGGVDPHRYTGEFVFADVIDKRSWMIKIDGMFFGDKQVGENFPGMVDSGTSLITGPEQLIDPIRESIFGPNNTKTSVPCAMANELSNVTFVISGKKFVLTPADYIVKEYSNVTCVFGFYSSKNLQFVVLGNAFMRKYYTMFDVGNRRIGFASAVEEGDDNEDPDENEDFNILAS